MRAVLKIARAPTAYLFSSNAPPLKQQHPREYGGAVGWWVVVGWGTLGASISPRSTTMTTDTRIESLETQVRTLKRMLFGVFGLIVVGGLLAATSLQSVPDVIRAKNFEVLNEEGVVIASLRENPHGRGWLSIRDEVGRSVAAITGDKRGGWLTIDNIKGNNVASLLVDEKGGWLIVKDHEGIASASVIADKEGGWITLSDEPQKHSVVIGVDDKGGWLTIHNKKGKPVAALNSDVDGGVLVVCNKDGVPVAEISTKSDGGGQVYVTDKQGKMSADMP
jgi:hypothetical protein